jgi:hypothetical protein
MNPTHLFLMAMGLFFAGSRFFITEEYNGWKKNCGCLVWVVAVLYCLWLSQTLGPDTTGKH